MRACFSSAIAGGLLILTGLIANADNSFGNNRSRNGYKQHNLVSDGFIPADHTDPNLVNPWGLSFNPGGDVWVADNGTGVATLYDGLGTPQSLVVTIPPPDGGTPPSAPNGNVFNFANVDASLFVVSKGMSSGPALFFFSTEDGTISGWNPTVDLNNAILVVDNSMNGTVYKGLALAGSGGGLMLYATDFHNNQVDVFDTSFKPVTTPGGFRDREIPRGFAPFNIQNILGNLYVTYAKQDAEKHDDVAGPGNGFVDVFSPDGFLIQRFARRGVLNSPWGLVLAPAGFGKFSGNLLVGNFGDGRIHAFDFPTGTPLGTLRAPDRSPLVIDGLWGLHFGNGVADQPPTTLYFASGPDQENHGLYGSIVAQPSTDGDDDGDDGDRYGG